MAGLTDGCDKRKRQNLQLLSGGAKMYIDRKNNIQKRITVFIDSVQQIGYIHCISVVAVTIIKNLMPKITLEIELLRYVQ